MCCLTPLAANINSEAFDISVGNWENQSQLVLQVSGDHAERSKGLFNAIDSDASHDCDALIPCHITADGQGQTMCNNHSSGVQPMRIRASCMQASFQ